MEELLRIRGLTVKFYTYEGVVHGLDKLDLDINPKETFGLVGESGSGKTLTALSILRLIPPPGRIEGGSIHFNVTGSSEPVDLLRVNEKCIRAIRGKRVSMIFQEPGAALNPVYTVGDQVSEVILLHRPQEVAREASCKVDRLLAETTGAVGALAKPARLAQRRLYRQIARSPGSPWTRIMGRIPLARRLLWRLDDEARKMTVSILKEVEMPCAEEVFRQYPHQLSGGMKQRCIIAMALACYPRLLIADEPTTALDVTIQAQILELLRRLKVERETSILYITHDLAIAAGICDRIGVMYSGSLCEIAAAEDLYARPYHPYTRALIAAVPKPGGGLNPIAGVVPDPLNLPSGCRFHPRCESAVEVCQGQAPQMQEISPGHSVACHIYGGGNGEDPR